MQNYNTIIGVIQMCQNNCSYSVIQNRYHIGSGTVQLILKRFESSGFSLEDLKSKEPSQVEEFFYPPDNHRQKDIPLPDFALYFDRIHSKGPRRCGRVGRARDAGDPEPRLKLTTRQEINTLTTRTATKN